MVASGDEHSLGGFVLLEDAGAELPGEEALAEGGFGWGGMGWFFSRYFDLFDALDSVAIAFGVHQFD